MGKTYRKLTKIELIRECIKLYYQFSQFSVSEIAELCGISQETVNNLCKAKYGITPGQLITMVRLQEAIFQMKFATTEKTFCPQKVGYLNDRTFKRHLKKYGAQINDKNYIWY